MSGMTLQQATVLTALNHMMSKEWFDICTVKDCAAVLGIPVRDTDAYKMLSALHCIPFAKMPRQVRESIVPLIRECLGVEPNQLFTESDVKQMQGVQWKRLLGA